MVVEETAGKGRRSRRPRARAPGYRRPVYLPRLWTVVVLAVLVGGAIGSFVVGRSVVDDQEERLLDQRTGEVAALLSNLIQSFSTNLGGLATVASVTEGDPDVFTARAEAAVEAEQFQTVALVDAGDGSVVAAAGPFLATGSVLGEPRVDVVERAGPQLVSTGVFTVGDTKRIGLALGPPLTPPGTVIYSETSVDPAQASAAASGEPFSDLDVALYASADADPAQLVLSTTGETGVEGEESEIALGAEQWTIVVGARKSLVGSLAANMPWILLASGLVVALPASLLVETLGRRRDLAVALVEERTRELRASLRELDEARDQLVQKERLAAVGELASAVGHELRNPLGVLSNTLYLLRGSLDDLGEVDSERLRRRVATAERELAAATLIVSDLLEFARQREPAKTAVSLPKLVEEVLSVAPPPSGVTTETRFADDAPLADADRDQLRQVLLNLVVNAYDALPEGGRVVVSTSRSGDQVRVVVSDTGIGMDDELRRQVFEPFFTGKTKGIGLGLAVSKRIVDAHGGEIRVESTPGEGSTFAVTLAAAHLGSPTVGARS